MPVESHQFDARESTSQHLLVCIDRPAVAGRLLRHAASLARVWNSHVTAMHILEVDSTQAAPAPVDSVGWHLRRVEARRVMAELASESKSAGLPIEVELGEGHAFEQIRTWSIAHHVSLTVLATHGAHGRTGCGLAGTAYKLIEGLSGSLLVVPSADGQPEPATGVVYRRILVPLDGSMHAASVLPMASQIAEAHHSELILAHVVPTPELMRIGPPAAEDLQLEEAVIRRNEKVAGDYLVGVRAHLQGLDVQTRTYLSHKGNPRDELLRIIDEEAIDLVVLSAHGSTGATDRAAGSVAGHLISHSRAPLLLIRKRTHSALHRDRVNFESRVVSARPPAVSAA